MWLSLLAILDWHTVLIELDLGSVVSIRHNRSSILLVVSVVDKEIVLLRVNDGFNKLPGVVSLPLENVEDDVHDLWTQAGESEEDLLNNRISKVFQLRVHVLDQISRWLSQLVQLGSNQIVEHIHRGESWDLISLVHGNSTLDCHV